MKSSELSNTMSATNFSLESGASVEANKSKFCEVWPPTKNGLELLKELVKNPVVKIIITTVIGAGDGIANMLGCNNL